MDVLSQGEIEERIIGLSDALEEETHLYAALNEEAATAEADYKLLAARALVAIAATGAKMNADAREARVEVQTAESHRAFLIAEARRTSCREALLSLRARLDALRTLSANVRQLTAPNR